MTSRKKRNRKQEIRRRGEAINARKKTATADILSDMSAASSWRDGLGRHEFPARSTPPNPKSPSSSDWAGLVGTIGTYIKTESKKTLESYRRQPNLVVEHANLEEDTARGGYATRQLFELVQNSADALAETEGGRIRIRLTATHLYCADEGKPIDPDGVRALMFSHLSSKRGTAEIGRFGLGFKSLLGVSDTPEFFSRTGSFRFDRDKADALIRPIVPGEKRYPVLRLPEAIDPSPEFTKDPILREFVSWATNIVRLPLKPQAVQTLDKQFKEFPPEFLLFVEHVSQLVLQNDVQENTRTFGLRHNDNLHILADGEKLTRWMITSVVHSLSPDARSDRRSLDDGSDVSITWAAPLERLTEPGRFWAYFPTMSTSLLAGILNAPWKTNEDRQNLLPGIFNDELIDAAAKMVAKILPQLSTNSDPAKHLDTLPRRHEAGDSEHSDRLRDQLEIELQGKPLVPDQDGLLRKVGEVSYPPGWTHPGRWETTTPYERWAAFGERPKNWIHLSALRRERLSRIISYSELKWRNSMPQATVRQWLEALVRSAKSLQTNTANLATFSKGRPTSSTRDEVSLQESTKLEMLLVQSSMAAIQTAILIPKSFRESTDLGNIVLTDEGTWVKPEPDGVHLSGDATSNSFHMVHPQLEADHDTLRALKELGLKPASSTSSFKALASVMLAPPIAEENRGSDRTRHERESGWCEFWRLAQDVGESEAANIIKSYADWREALRVRTIRGLYTKVTTGE